MRRSIALVAVTAVATLGITILVAVLVARAGLVDISVEGEDPLGVAWLLETAAERSITRQAARAVENGSLVPPASVSEQMLASGAVHYRAMCVACHGAPGVERGEMGQGLAPRPPDLARVARRRSAAEIQWVLANGIRHTGMPAFGATHGADELWALTAFVERLDGMSPEEYRRRTAPPPAPENGPAAATPPGHDGHDHAH